MVQDMSSLRDYIAYARSYIQPSLSEEAGQALIQAYVDMRKIGSSRGAVTAYPRQLESLIRLAEAHAKMRLHREALKQAATDPKTGIIDVGILTTGVSSSERSRRQLLAKELLKLLQSKAKSGAQLKTQAVLEMMQAQSQVPVSQAQFEAALRILRDEDAITVTGQTVRVC
ncbi:DNA replication licensing factor MCM4 [Geodia barretti]|uniref:DNA replication licensing factor MCM4 n=1 Tax=Geodia barretti TaxID=519541 RepID=A0AA35T312_GEOBA|nr:DNA replication licensing factor MCM4 [Geodia barretti]